MAYCTASNNPSIYWINCIKVNSSCLITVNMEFSLWKVAFNRNISLARLSSWTCDWIICSFTALDRFAIASAFTLPKSFTYGNWLDTEWAMSEFLCRNSSSTSCISERVAVPKICFNTYPPKSNRPRRGSNLGRTCWKSFSLASNVASNKSVFIYMSQQCQF